MLIASQGQQKRLWKLESKGCSRQQGKSTTFRPFTATAKESVFHSSASSVEADSTICKSLGGNTLSANGHEWLQSGASWINLVTYPFCTVLCKYSQLNMHITSRDGASCGANREVHEANRCAITWLSRPHQPQCVTIRKCLNNSTKLCLTIHHASSQHERFPQSWRKWQCTYNLPTAHGGVPWNTLTSHS